MIWRFGVRLIGAVPKTDPARRVVIHDYLFAFLNQLFRAFGRKTSILMQGEAGRGEISKNTHFGDAF